MAATVIASKKRSTAPVTNPFRGEISRPNKSPAKIGTLRRNGWWLAPVGLFVVSLLAAFSGDPVIVLAPTLLLVLTWAAFALPLDAVLPAIVFIMVSLNAPAGHPGSDIFHWPLNPFGKLLYANLPTKFAIADVIVLLLTLRAITIILLNESGMGIDRRPPKPFAQACLIGVAAIVGCEIWGVFLGGGDFKNSLWQLRIPLLVPCLALATSVAATDRGIRRIRFAFLAAGVHKALEAAIANWGAGLKNIPDVIYVTTHSDTVLWATCVAILFADWFEYRRHSDRSRLVVLLPVYLLAMVANNRRTVWVAVAVSLVFIAIVAHRPVKRQLARLFAITWPLILAYLVLGLASSSVVFKPIHMVQSVLLQNDTSSSTRDIENFNLLVTLKARPIVGWGFGHQYLEIVRAYDISHGFVQYRYLPHNSFLGFWAFNGLLGAGAYFLLFVVGLFYLISARRTSVVPARRAAATWAVCAVIAYLIQAWADVGMQDWTPMVCLAVALGIGGALGRSVMAESDDLPDSEFVDYVDDEPDGLDPGSSPLVQMTP